MKLDGKFICLINWDDWNIGESKRDTEDSNCHSNSNIWLPRIWRITAFFEDRSLFDPGPSIGYCIVATRRTFQLFQSHKRTPIFSRRIYFFHPICAYYFHPTTWSRQFLSKQFLPEKTCTLGACLILFGDSASQVCKASSSKSMPFLSGSSELRGVSIVHSFTSAEKSHLSFKVINTGYLRLSDPPHQQQKSCKDMYALSVPGGFAKLQNVWW